MRWDVETKEEGSDMTEYLCITHDINTQRFYIQRNHKNPTRDEGEHALKQWEPTVIISWKRERESDTYI